MSRGVSRIAICGSVPNFEDAVEHAETIPNISGQFRYGAFFCRDSFRVAGFYGLEAPRRNLYPRISRLAALHASRSEA